jgi:hypothetical protein
LAPAGNKPFSLKLINKGRAGLAGQGARSAAQLGEKGIYNGLYSFELAFGDFEEMVGFQL